MHLITSTVPAPQFPRCTARTQSQVCPVSPLGSWSLTSTLLVDVNHPILQEDFTSKWEPVHSLVKDAASGAKVAPRLPALAVAHLSLWLQRGEGLVHTQLALLWYSLNPLFCEWTRLCLRAFSRKVLSLSLFIFPLGLSHSLGCYLMLAPSDCPQGIQAWSPPCTCNLHLPVQPCSLQADTRSWATSPLGVTVRCVICGFIFFPSQLCCPARFQNRNRLTNGQTCGCLSGAEVKIGNLGLTDTGYYIQNG